MTSRQLEIFFLLSENLSFGKTADALFLAQSSVSREIQALEKELGFPLFQRSFKSVHLTEKGREFKQALAPLINSIHTEISRIKNQPSQYTHRLRIGFFHIPSLKNIPDAVRIFHQRFPLVLPELRQGNLDQLCQMFHAGQLDLMLAVRCVMNPKPSDQVKDIYAGRFCATMPADHPLAVRTSLEMSELDGYDLLGLDSSSSAAVFRPLNAELRHNCPNSMVIHCSSTDVQEVYLQAGIGVVLSTEYSFQPKPSLRQIPVHSKFIDSLQTNYAAMWHTQPSDCHVEDFISILEEVLGPDGSTQACQKS